MKSKKSVCIIITVVCVLMAVLGCGIGVYFGAAPAHDDVIMIGHRGYSSQYPDNTAISFINAAKHGSKGVETDVRYTKDGVYVLSHDSEAVFADGSSLVIAEATYAELVAKPLYNARKSVFGKLVAKTGADELENDVYICTLKEYLEICKEYGLICFIELKGDYDSDQIREVFTYIQNYYSLDMCELQSFNFDVLVEAQKMFPDLHFMLTWGSDRGDYSKCFDYGFDIDSSYWSLTKKMVDEFHERGLKVAAWTANDIFTMQYCYWFDVDYIESDVF